MIRGGIVTLNVRDVGHAARFYIETLGMKLVEEEAPTSFVIDAGEGFRIRLRSGDPIAKGPALDLEPKVPIDEAIAIYENRGVTFSTDRAGGVTTARFEDPDGNVLRLVQRQPPQPHS